PDPKTQRWAVRDGVPEASGLGQRFAEFGQSLVMTILGQQVPGADHERHGPVKYAEGGKGDDSAVEREPLRRRQPHRAQAFGQLDQHRFAVDQPLGCPFRKINRRLARRSGGLAAWPAPPRMACPGGMVSRLGSHRRSPARERVAETHGYGYWPLDHPGRARYAQAGNESHALVRDMPDNGQVYPGLVTVMMGVVRGTDRLIGRWSASVLGLGAFGHLLTLRRSASLGITLDGWYRVLAGTAAPGRSRARGRDERRSPDEGRSPKSPPHPSRTMPGRSAPTVNDHAGLPVSMYWRDGSAVLGTLPDQPSRREVLRERRAAGER